MRLSENSAGDREAELINELSNVCPVEKITVLYIKLLVATVEPCYSKHVKVKYLLRVNHYQIPHIKLPYN